MPQPPSGHAASGFVHSDRARRNRGGIFARMAAKPTDIDLYYGLEPVIEPGAEAGSDALERFTELTCPYCDEIALVRLDLSAGSQCYVEDCQVCCQPVEISVAVGSSGQLERVDGERMDR